MGRRCPCMAFPGWIDRLRSRCGSERAQTMAEYAVVLGVITPAIILAYGLFADQIAEMFDTFRGFFP
jgi:Flp pilus assembly pilin Flp